MKKILLAFAILFVAKLNAQIVNNSFENWRLDTSYFAGFTGIIPGDTFTYNDPVGWTSANGVTGSTGLGNFILATQSNTAYTGTSSIQLMTDTLKSIYISYFGAFRQLVVPGLILNGVFPVSSITQNIVSLSGGTISPSSVPGAGQPFTQRLADFTGNYQYTPVYDSFTHSMDTCEIWASLRKGSTTVANAIFKTQAPTNGSWGSFNVPFVYLNCETPDTLVVLLASSLPNFGSLLNGNTDLTPGSVMLVDNLGYDTLAANVNFVFAKNDLDTVNRGRTDTLNVLANDTSCNGSLLTVTITTGPANGTATVLSNNEISYTPTVTYVGRDSIYYTATDASSAHSSAWLKIMVEFGVGISEANDIPVRMFPVPASNQLHLQFENKGKTTARIYDVVGNLVSVVTLTQNDNNINVSNLTNGIYGIQLADESNIIIARGKFAISK